MKIYTWGYSKRSLADLKHVLESLQGDSPVIIDVRRSTISKWKPEFSSTSLIRGAGPNYINLGHWLGNQHKALPWKRHEFWQRGIVEAHRLLGQAGSVLLLCLEQNPAECHRREVAEELAAVSGAEIVHLGWEEPQPKQEELF